MRLLKNFLIKIILMIIIFSSFAFSNNNRIWSAGTAYLLPSKRFEVGLFQPFRYGISDKTEISFHPIAMFISPNFSLKKSYTEFNGFSMASNHSVFYPTFLLKTIAMEGTGGILSPEFKDDIPQMFSIYNGIILSRSLTQDHLISFKLGLNLAVRFDDIDSRTTIDLPIVYSRLQVFYNGYGLRGGVDLYGKLVGKLNYLIDTDLFLYPGADESMAFEHKGMLLLNKSSKIQISCGYKLIFGSYPFGTQWHLLPVFDLQWGKN